MNNAMMVILVALVILLLLLELMLLLLSCYCLLLLLLLLLKLSQGENLTTSFSLDPFPEGGNHIGTASARCRITGEHHCCLAAA